MIRISLFLIISIAAASVTTTVNPDKPVTIVVDSDSDSIDSESPSRQPTSTPLRLRQRRVSFRSPTKAGSVEPLFSLAEKDNETDDDEEEGRAKPLSPVFFGDDGMNSYFDDKTGREMFETELLPVTGDADLMLALEGKDVIMPSGDAINLVLLTIASSVALYGWTMFSMWLYNYYTSL